ncbi:MAG: hypothetical protein M1828_002490 [Chrysothrix sp. TS-e1954]|nr:MAG: hypothetical protein M1828_002490 [Chrysothrix sp. TS-e1954]
MRTWAAYVPQIGLRCGTAAPRPLLDAVLNPDPASGQITFFEFCEYQFVCEDETKYVYALENHSGVTHNGDGTILIRPGNEQDVRAPAGGEKYTPSDATSTKRSGVGYEIGPTIVGAGDSPNNTDTNLGVQGGHDADRAGTCGGNCGTNPARAKPSPPHMESIGDTWILTSGCFPTSTNGRRRGEDEPCACSTTYVSYGCWLTDGLLWEEDKAKLGALPPSDV